MKPNAMGGVLFRGLGGVLKLDNRQS